MKSVLEDLTITDFFAINIFNSLVSNAKYQIIDKKSLIKESYELAVFMNELHFKKLLNKDVSKDEKRT